MPLRIVGALEVFDVAKGGEVAELALRDLRELIAERTSIEAVYMTPAAALRRQADAFEARERLYAKIRRFVACMEFYWKEPDGTVQ